MRVNWDFLGMSASLACAIHCAVLPLFLTALPFFGWEILHNPWFEWGMVITAFGIGTGSLWHGYKQHHRRRAPVTLFVIGFMCLIAKEIFDNHATLLLIPAAGLIVSAHYLNWRYTSKTAQGGANRAITPV